MMEPMLNILIEAIYSKVSEQLSTLHFSFSQILFL